MNNEEMSNKQMKNALKTVLEDIRSGDMNESQGKEVNKAMLNVIKFSKNEMEYKKMTNSKKSLKIYV